MFEKKQRLYFSERIEQYSSTKSSDNFAKREQYKKIMEVALKTQLTTAQAQALELYYVQDMSIYEIAHVQGVHPSTVSRRINTATQRARLFADACLQTLPKTQNGDY